MGLGELSASPPAVLMVNDDEYPSLAVAGIGEQEMEKKSGLKRSAQNSSMASCLSCDGICKDRRFVLPTFPNLLPLSSVGYISEQHMISDLRANSLARRSTWVIFLHC